MYNNIRSYVTVENAGRYKQCCRFDLWALGLSKLLSIEKIYISLKIKMSTIDRKRLIKGHAVGISPSGHENIKEKQVQMGFVLRWPSSSYLPYINYD